MIAFRTLFSERLAVARLTDEIQSRLERELGIRFHGVSTTGERTVGHRFIEDDTSSAIVLRVVSRDTGGYAIELVAVGDTVMSPDEADEHRAQVRAAIGAVRDSALSGATRPLGIDLGIRQPHEFTDCRES